MRQGLKFFFIIALMLIGGGLTFFFMERDFFRKKSEPNAQNREKIIYVCPMNDIPGYFSEKPGNCPKCGMTLIPQKKKQFREKRAA